MLRSLGSTSYAMGATKTAEYSIGQAGYSNLINALSSVNKRVHGGSKKLYHRRYSLKENPGSLGSESLRGKNTRGNEEMYVASQGCKC
jgi:hypothetical protein